MKKIPLTQGKVAVVDDSDYEDLSRFKWCAHWEGGILYAVRHVRKPDGKLTTERMHRRILGLKLGDRRLCDHKDHNGLDNRRANLRVCTRAENHQNGRSHRNSTSQFKGVYWDKVARKWRAQIYVSGKKIHLGYFDSEIEAAKAYDRAAIQYFGEFAYLNRVA